MVTEETPIYWAISSVDNFILQALQSFFKILLIHSPSLRIIIIPAEFWQRQY